MIRIKTRFNEKDYVYTILFAPESFIWITFVHHNGHKVLTYEARDLQDAGRNHLQSAYALREKVSPKTDMGDDLISLNGREI